MKIESLELFRICLPLVEPFQVSNAIIAERDAIVVRLRADGLSGYGESAPNRGPFYSGETIDTAWLVLKDYLAPLVVRRDFDTPEQINAAFADVRGNQFARAGIETAFWDLLGQARGQPISRMLGGEGKAVACGIALGITDTIEQLVAQAQAARDIGYWRVKIKVRPGWDVKPLAALREQLGDFPLFVDANAAYTLEHLDTLRELDQFDLMMIEQPLGYDDLADHAELAAQLKTPVCLDESIHSIAALKAALKLKSCSIVNIKIQRVGGLLAAKGVHDLCQESGIPVWVGTMPETGIGQTQGLHLATLPNCRFPTDVEPSRRWYHDDIISPWIELRGNGTLAVPIRPGLGVGIDEQALVSHTVAKWRSP